MSSYLVHAFGREVRRRRIALGISLDMLSRSSGLTPGFLGTVETGKRSRGPSLDVALRIAEGLGTNLPDLLGGYQGLSPEGMDVAHAIQAMPPRTRAALLAFLKANQDDFVQRAALR